MHLTHLTHYSSIKKKIHLTYRTLNLALNVLRMLTLAYRGAKSANTKPFYNKISSISCNFNLLIFSESGKQGGCMGTEW